MVRKMYVSEPYLISFRLKKINFIRTNSVQKQQQQNPVIRIYLDVIVRIYFCSRFHSLLFFVYLKTYHLLCIFAKFKLNLNFRAQIIGFIFFYSFCVQTNH